MRVFISWSGERSRAIAETLHDWLQKVLHSVKPYFAPNDIAMGDRWGIVNARELSESKIGIICLTRENIASPWLMFEAGAISKSIEDSKVCPLLFDVEKTDLVGPLLSFQAAKFNKVEMRKVVGMLNAELARIGENSLPPKLLDETFEKWWPELEGAVFAELTKGVPHSVGRPERAILQEILERMRVESQPQANLNSDQVARLRREMKTEIRGRLLSGLGHVIGEMSIEPNSFKPLDLEKIREASELCQQGYQCLIEIGGAPEFMALNNLLYYSSFIDDRTRASFFLSQARRLLEAGQVHNAANLVLTGCKVILQLSTESEERERAFKILSDLASDLNLPEKQRREAGCYLVDFQP